MSLTFLAVRLTLFIRNRVMPRHSDWYTNETRGDVFWSGEGGGLYECSKPELPSLRSDWITDKGVHLRRLPSGEIIVLKETKNEVE